MSSYFYNGMDITNLIEGGSTSVPDYIGFPESTPSIYTSGLDKPYNFSYSYQGTDVSNYATAFNISHTGGTGTIPTTIPGAPGYSFKHISAVCWGGGGGGGGGGGYGSGGVPIKFNPGASGSPGNNGAYAAILSYPINGLTVNYYVGSGGNNGNGGANKIADKGDNGTSGNNGTYSYVYVDGLSITYSPGGIGGPGGNGGNVVNGNSGTTPNTPATDDSTIASPGYSGTTSANIPGVPVYPAQNTGQGGGGGSTNPGGNEGFAGATGTPGYIQVYLTYQ